VDGVFCRLIHRGAARRFFKVRNSILKTFEYRLIGIKNRSDHDEAIDLGAQMSRIFKDTCLIQ
jgi:hypothetical protein